MQKFFCIGFSVFGVGYGRERARAVVGFLDAVNAVGGGLSGGLKADGLFVLGNVNAACFYHSRHFLVDRLNVLYVASADGLQDNVENSIAQSAEIVH